MFGLVMKASIDDETGENQLVVPFAGRSVDMV